MLIKHRRNNPRLIFFKIKDLRGSSRVGVFINIHNFTVVCVYKLFHLYPSVWEYFLSVLTKKRQIVDANEYKYLKLLVSQNMFSLFARQSPFARFIHNN